MDVNLFINLSLTNGDIVELFIQMNDGIIKFAGEVGQTNFLIREFGVNTDFEDTPPSWDLYNSPSLLGEQLVDFKLGVPNISCFDFFKSMITMFNLVVIQDETTKEILIEPYNWYYNDEDRVVRDFTNILDTNSSYKVEPLSFDLSKEVIWTNSYTDFEFLNKQFTGVKHFLNKYNYGDSIGVNWLMFGSNNLVQEPSGLILENYTRSSEMLDQHVKSFVRPNEVKYSDNPHYYHVRNPSKMMGIQFNIIKSPQCFNKINVPFYNAPAYIAHYVYQSEESYKKRKIDLIGDNGITRPDMKKEIHQFYNDGLNLQPQKYIIQIKEMLNYYQR